MVGDEGEQQEEGAGEHRHADEFVQTAAAGRFEDSGKWIHRHDCDVTDR